MRQSLLLAIHSPWSVDSASGLLCICPSIRTYTSQSQLVRLGGSPTTKDGSDVFLRQSRAVVCVDVRRLASSSNCLWMRKSLKLPRASHVLTNLPCQGHQSVHQLWFLSRRILRGRAASSGATAALCTSLWPVSFPPSAGSINVLRVRALRATSRRLDQAEGATKEGPVRNCDR